MRALVIQTAFPGDVLLTVPLLDALRSLPATTRLAALVTPEGASILETQRVADELIVYDKRSRDVGLAGFARTVRAVRSYRPDAAVIPHRSFRSALLGLLSGARRRIGFDASGGRALLTDVVSYERGAHEIERVASLARPLGWSGGPGRVPFRLEVPESGVAEVSELLVSAGVRETERLLACAPGSRWTTKRWPPERFAAALDELEHALEARAVLVGTADDAGPAAEVLSASSGRVVDLTGRLTTAGWLALVERARLLLSNDSAALHVAAGVGTPVVAVFGPTVPAQGFGPYTDRGRVAEADVRCRPCGRHGGETCPDGTLRCMLDVEVDAVVRLGLEAVEGSGRAA